MFSEWGSSSKGLEKSHQSVITSKTLSCLSLTKHFSCLSGVNTAKHVTHSSRKRIQAADKGISQTQGQLLGVPVSEEPGTQASSVMQLGKAVAFLLDLFSLAAWRWCMAAPVFCGQRLSSG